MNTNRGGFILGASAALAGVAWTPMRIPNQEGKQTNRWQLTGTANHEVLSKVSELQDQPRLSHGTRFK